MRTVNIAKAGATVDPVQSITIVIDTEIATNIKQPLNEVARIYQEEADKLHEALKLSLPGGVYDKLLVNMMTARASLFKVPLFDETAVK